MTPFKNSDFTVFVSGLFAFLLIGYISHNAIVVKTVKEKVVEEVEVLVKEIETIEVIETETDTLYRDRFIPLYLDVSNTEFEEVFRYYRDEYGPCSTFDWRGNIYVTRLDTESKDICAPEIR